MNVCIYTHICISMYVSIYIYIYIYISCVTHWCLRYTHGMHQDSSSKKKKKNIRTTIQYRIVYAHHVLKTYKLHAPLSKHLQGKIGHGIACVFSIIWTLWVRQWDERLYTALLKHSAKVCVCVKYEFSCVCYAYVMCKWCIWECVYILTYIQTIQTIQIIHMYTHHTYVYAPTYRL